MKIFPKITNKNYFTLFWGFLFLFSNLPAQAGTGDGEGVVVAVISTGVDYNHPDLKDNIWINPKEDLNCNGKLDLGAPPSGDYDGIDNDNNGLVDDIIGLNQVVRTSPPLDSHGRGTQLAGIIIGVAPKAKIMPIKIMNAPGDAVSASTVAEGVKYAAANGADVALLDFNCLASICGLSANSTITPELSSSVGKNILVIVPSGDNGGLTTNYYPQNNANVMVASAVDASGNLVTGSTTGANVAVSGLGAGVSTTTLGSGYTVVSGTAPAASQVVGLAAAVKSKYANLTQEDMRRILKVSANDVGVSGYDTSFGYGRVDKVKALARSWVGAAKIASPKPGEFLNLYQGVMNITGTATNGPGANEAFSSYELFIGKVVQNTNNATYKDVVDDMVPVEEPLTVSPITTPVPGTGNLLSNWNFTLDNNGQPRSTGLYRLRLKVSEKDPVTQAITTVYEDAVVVSLEPDADHDGIVDKVDNCVIGNANDKDCDGVKNIEDNCTEVANGPYQDPPGGACFLGVCTGNQLDSDNDGYGNPCDTDTAGVTSNGPSGAGIMAQDADSVLNCQFPIACGDGNHAIQGNEQCDGPNLNGQTCQTLGFASGVLNCYAPGNLQQCQFDSTGCSNNLPPAVTINVNSAVNVTAATVAGNSTVRLHAVASDPEGEGLGYPIYAWLGNNTPIAYVWELDGGTFYNNNIFLANSYVTQAVFPYRATPYNVKVNVYDVHGARTVKTVAISTTLCGNGVVTSPEQCDDGNTSNADTCTNGCSISVCGDAIVRQGVEECDDGNKFNNDKCGNDCKINKITMIVNGQAFPDPPRQITVYANTPVSFAYTATRTLGCSWHGYRTQHWTFSDGTKVGYNIFNGPASLTHTYTQTGSFTAFIDGWWGDYCSGYLGTAVVVNVVAQVCGNGVVEGTEQCDGANLNGKTCATTSPYDGGSLSCSSTCSLVTTNCYDCGNGSCEAAKGETATNCAVDCGCTSDSNCPAGQHCKTGANICVACTNNAHCNDSLYCNGTETCNLTTNACQAGTAPTLTDNVSCTTDSCNEATDTIIHTPNNSACSDGAFCNGSEVCNATLGCQAGTAPCNPATQTCNESNDTCPAICDNDSICEKANGETKANCPTDCICTTNADCDDGVYCNGSGSCAPDGRSCLNEPVPVPGWFPGCTNCPPPCATPVCNESTHQFDFIPNNAFCSDGLYCNGSEVCNVTSGCQAGTAPTLTDNVSCTTDSCNETTDMIIHTPNNAACSDGLFCNGSEVCNATLGCQTGTAPTLTDNVSCTTDSCNETTDTIIHTPNDAACSDGAFCNGSEICNATLGCQTSITPPCNPVTQACNESTDQCVAQCPAMTIPTDCGGVDVSAGAVGETRTLSCLGDCSGELQVDCTTPTAWTVSGTCCSPRCAPLDLSISRGMTSCSNFPGGQPVLPAAGAFNYSNVKTICQYTSPQTGQVVDQCSYYRCACYYGEGSRWHEYYSSGSNTSACLVTWPSNGCPAQKFSSPQCKDVNLMIAARNAQLEVPCKDKTTGVDTGQCYYVECRDPASNGNGTWAPLALSACGQSDFFQQP